MAPSRALRRVGGGDTLTGHGLHSARGGSAAAGEATCAHTRLCEEALFTQEDKAARVGYLFTAARPPRQKR